MTKEEDFKLLKIQTCFLRVNIHCDGCRQKVKKLLQRIEGVFQVATDAENQKVTVHGSVDPDTLIRRLVKAGKHAELWTQKAYQHQKQKNNSVKDDKLVNKGPKQQQQQQQQHKLTVFDCEDVFDDCLGEEGEDFDDEELQLLKERAAHLGLFRQRAIEANNAKKGVGIGQIAGPAANNGKMNNKSGNGKKVDPNQQMSMRNNLSGIDPKAMAAAMRMNNGHSLGNGSSGVNMNIGGDAKRGNNDLSSMMNMAGFNGNFANFNTPSSSLGVNTNPQGGYQLQQNNGYQSSSSAPPGFPMTPQQYQPSAVNGYNHHQSSQMMNMLNRQQAMNHQQPQMMYNRAQLIPPNTGYYYNYCPNPIPPTYPYPDPYYYQGHNSNSAADMFSDENTSSCSIM